MSRVTPAQIADAHDRLAEALSAALVAGQRPPCAEPGNWRLWLSEDPQERAVAADRCHECQIIDVCGETAEASGERWGVWAGVDRSPVLKGRPAQVGEVAA